jgi:hypothetical protein
MEWGSLAELASGALAASRRRWVAMLLLLLWRLLLLLMLASEASQEVVWRAAGDLWLPPARRRVKLQARQKHRWCRLVGAQAMPVWHSRGAKLANWLPPPSSPLLVSPLHCRLHPRGPCHQAGNLPSPFLGAPPPPLPVACLAE